jgi:hypothetical protein
LIDAATDQKLKFSKFNKTIIGFTTNFQRPDASPQYANFLFGHSVYNDQLIVGVTPRYQKSQTGWFVVKK